MNYFINRYRLIALYFRTIKHLKFVQIYYRIFYKIYKPRITLYGSIDKSCFEVDNFVQPILRRQSLIGPGEWELLNKRAKLSEVGWNSVSEEKLWVYNQHYFDDLNAVGGHERTGWHVQLMSNWIQDNPVGSGNGWEPYPLSLRIVNWIKWCMRGNQLSDSCLENLAVQCRWLSLHVEWHLLGNHLFVNAKALVFAGLFFNGDEANTWFSRGMQILKKQIVEQILDDGAQFELSPMYHALAIEDLLDLLNICSTYSERLNSNHKTQVENWKLILPKMLHWLDAMSHPDGKISFFNDAAFGIAPENHEIHSYANRLGIQGVKVRDGLIDLSSSGFFRVNKKDVSLFFDAGEIGPSYLPGHAHADTLSIELTFNRKRIVVNSGTSEYGSGPIRLRQRATAQHNTVCVLGENSSEVWSGFRVGNRASITERRVIHDTSSIAFMASHNGYARSLSGLIHKRTIRLVENSVFIEDEISRCVPSEIRFHLHPDVKLKTIAENFVEFTVHEEKTMRWCFQGHSEIRVLETAWHPEFGITIPNLCIAAQFEHGVCQTSILW